MSMADIAFLNAVSGVALPPPSRQIHHLELTGGEPDRVLLAHCKYFVPCFSTSPPLALLRTIVYLENEGDQKKLIEYVR